jgi:hypothetical protein
VLAWRSERRSIARPLAVRRRSDFMAGLVRLRLPDSRALALVAAPRTDCAAPGVSAPPMTERSAAAVLSSQRLIAGSNALSLPRERGDGII